MIFKRGHLIETYVLIMKLKVQVEWLHNGHPLKAGSRYCLVNDFGFVSLDIDYVIAEDAGTYTLLVTNPEGDA